MIVKRQMKYEGEKDYWRGVQSPEKDASAQQPAAAMAEGSSLTDSLLCSRP